MKSSKVFNNISDKLKKEIPKLKPGETVLFQMLNGVPNGEPDLNERSKNPVLYGKRQVQTNFRIYDPYIKDEEGAEVGGYVDVGCVDAWNGEQPVRFRMFVPGMSEYSQFQGKFSLTGGNIKDEELFEILWLSHEREGNTHRDTSVEPLFRIVDTKTDSKQVVTKIDILRKALDIAKSISEKDSVEVMAALNQPTYQDKEVLKAKINELAKNQPEDFIKAYDSKDRGTIATIKKAIELGIIDHNFATGDVKIGDVTLTTLKVETLDGIVPAFASWVKTAKNGADVYANLVAQLEEKQAAKA